MTGVEVSYLGAEQAGGGVALLHLDPGSFRLLASLPATIYSTTMAIFQPMTRAKGRRGKEVLFFQGNNVKVGHTSHI